MVEKYKHLVDQGREQFRRELESIVPNVKIGEKKGELVKPFLFLYPYTLLEKKLISLAITFN